MKSLLTNLVRRLRALWQTEPARVVSYTVIVVLFVASKLHVVLDPASTTTYVAIILPLIFGTEVVRKKVTPFDGGGDTISALPGPALASVPTPDQGNATPPAS